MRRGVFTQLVLLVVLAVPFSGAGTSALPPGTPLVEPRFEPAPCSFPLAADQVAGRPVRCGFVRVPEERTRPDGGLLRLAVAIFKSPGVATRPALVFLAGGPGAAIVEVFGPGVTGALARDLTA